MQANISLIFNLLLLGGVVYAIFRMLRKQPSNQAIETISSHSKEIERDDIIAIRKIEPEENVVPMDKIHKENTAPKVEKSKTHHQLYFLVPNKQTEFHGYNLLQSLLAAKLRFGEGNFFHYYQQQDGVTEPVFTVTATSETGEFDLNQMHSFSTRGLCLFIEPKADETKNEEAQTLLLETASRLCDLLDATVLNDAQKPIEQAAPEETETTI